MATAALNRFARYYNAQILRRSGANSRLGDLYDWAGLFNQRLEPMDDNLINWVEADKASRENLRAQVQAAPTYPAQFADIIDLTNTLKIGIKPDLPNVPAELAADLTNKKVISFQFQGVITRPMPDELGIQLRYLLERFKTEHFNDYQQHIRSYDLALALYYAKSVVLKVDHTTALSAEAKTQVKAIGGTVSLTSEGHQELRFSQADCPFAVTLRASKDY